MSNAARSSFNLAKIACSLMLTASMLSGCMTNSKLRLMETFSFQRNEATGSVSPTAAPVEKTATIDKTVTNSAAKAPVAPRSAWCNYTAADAGAEASILRSPTLNASASDGGSKSISLGMNLLDFAKANEVENVAQLRCQQKQSEGSLSILLLVANQSNTALGSAAKANYLSQSMGKLDAVAAQSRDLLNSGDITAAEASMIETRLARVRQSHAEAKVEAAKVETIAGGKGLTVPNAASRLRFAEQKLQESNARMRTLNAMSVNVETGWQANDRNVLTTSSGSGQFFGKVSVGLRFGAISPNRMRYEEAAQQARVAALGESYTGIVWQSDRAAESVESARKGLATSHGAIAGALNNARETLAALRGSDRVELASTQLIAEVDVIALAAELAAIDASLATLKSNSELARSTNR